MLMNKFLLALLIFVYNVSPSLAGESVFPSSRELAVAGDKAYLVESIGGTSYLVQYSFPALVQIKQLALGDNFSYASVNTNGVVVYNYSSDVKVEPTESIQPIDSPTPKTIRNFFKETQEIKTYDTDFNQAGSKTLEFEYYYDLIDDTVGLSSAAKTQCGGKKVKGKKNQCNKVFTSRISKPTESSQSLSQ